MVRSLRLVPEQSRATINDVEWGVFYEICVSFREVDVIETVGDCIFDQARVEG